MTLLGVVLPLFACTLQMPLLPGRSDPDVATRAGEAGFEAMTLDAAGFELQAYARERADAPALIVYIEGDGHAWRSRRRVSDDPTPRDPVALALALRDPSAAVLYLARPCQFLQPEALARCDARYWTSDRYGEAVVRATSAAIDDYLARRQPGTTRPRLGLVGFSGGGAVAALVAARRDDVAWFATVAGNLDHAGWTTHHGVTALTGSLNPVTFAASLRDVPQVHLAGASDEIVPVRLLRSYVSRLGPGAPVNTHVVDAFDHRCCWERVWPDALCAALPAVTRDVLLACTPVP